MEIGDLAQFLVMLFHARMLSWLDLFLSITYRVLHIGWDLH